MAARGAALFRSTTFALMLGMAVMTCTGENRMVAKTIQEVLKEHTDPLMSLPGVVGTAQGLCEGKPCIKVFVIKKTLELEQKIPKTIDGYPVMIEVTGEIRPLPGKRDQ